MGKITKILIAANLCLWVYFCLAFARASQPYDPRPGGHLPVDPYSFWGHAIGLTKSSLTYPFMKLVFWLEFPSFFLVKLIRNWFLPTVTGDTLIAGVSSGGYELVTIMFVSFFQWYLLGRIAKKLWAKIGNRAGGPDVKS